MESYAELIAEEIPKNAFVLAKEMLTELGKEEPKHFNGYWESRRQIAAPQGVSAYSHEYDLALKLVEVALRAALDDKQGRVTIQKTDNGREIRMSIANQQEPLQLPLKAAAAKLGEMERTLSDPRNWQQDAEGNYRHAAIFDTFGKYGLGVSALSYSIFNDFSADLFRPNPEAPIDDLNTLVSTDNHMLAPIGICLNYPKVERLSALAGFKSPVISR